MARDVLTHPHHHSAHCLQVCIECVVVDDSDAEDDSAIGSTQNTLLASRRSPRVGDEDQGEHQRVGFLAALQMAGNAGGQGLDWKTSEAWCSCWVPWACDARSHVT